MSACRRLGVLACISAFPLLASAQARFDVRGGEYPIVGALQGDQVFPQLALNSFGGYLVWQDNATDGDGSGISARRMNRSLSGSLGVFRINEQGAGDQTLPQVALLANGGAVFVWQSAVGGSVKVYARFLKPDGTFATGDVPVSAFSGGDQITPVVASLKDGTVVVVWSAVGQERTATGQAVSNGMQGVFAQRFTATGAKLGNEFQVNISTPLNQRTPDVAALADGNFAVVWVSEIYRGVADTRPTSQSDPGAGLNVYDIVLVGRIFDTNGNATTGELAISSNALVCANPSLASTSDGFTVAWSGKPNHMLSDAEQKDGWDIYGRLFGLSGTPQQPEFRINSYTFGDQYRPRARFQDGINLVLWSSMGQDGSWEGVVSRLITSSGQFLSTEFRVNTSTIGRQIYPTVSGDGEHSFLAVWSSFVGGVNSFDLYAQRYASTSEQVLAAPGAPYVSAISQTRLSVTWPELSGYTGAKYALYVDQSATPVVVENNSSVITSLQPDSTHSFRLGYVLADGSRSALSDASTGKTWGEDNNFDGLPDDWQTRYWGNNPADWPSASEDSDGDGASNLQELLAGTDPTDASSALRVKMTSTVQGPRLEWNTRPGNLYQVQLQNVGEPWVSIGTQRFAAGNTDSIPLSGDQSVALYRVIRVR